MLSIDTYRPLNILLNIRRRSERSIQFYKKDFIFFTKNQDILYTGCFIRKHFLKNVSVSKYPRWQHSMMCQVLAKKLLLKWIGVTQLKPTETEYLPQCVSLSVNFIGIPFGFVHATKPVFNLVKLCLHIFPLVQMCMLVEDYNIFILYSISASQLWEHKLWSRNLNSFRLYLWLFRDAFGGIFINLLNAISFRLHCWGLGSATYLYSL